MTVAVDLQRRVRASLGADFDELGPGEMLPLFLEDGSLDGFGYCCPGCGRRSYLGVGPSSSQTWRVVSGDPRDPRDPGTLTLSPSIHHTTALGGCGWHGYLRAGELAPC